jgi:transcriptional regulator with XRE-family HTH domain
MESINRRFAEALADSGLSETELANRLGVKQQTVNNWKLGKSKPKQVMQAARELNVSPDWLLYGTEPKSRKPDTGIVASLSAIASALSEADQQMLHRIAESLYDKQKKLDDK